MSSIPTINAEKESLETHVDLCAQRYQELDKRLLSLDQKVDGINKKFDTLNGDLKKVLITTMGTITTSILALIGVLAIHFIK